MDEVAAQSEGPRRFSAAIVSSIALEAVLLAGLGIYSIAAFSVASRVPAPLADVTVYGG